MGRRVVTPGSQHFSAGDHIRARAALDVNYPDAQVIFKTTLHQPCWKATSPIVLWRRLKRSVHRHNTPIVGLELTPEFCIESCFTYTIDGRRKTFSQK